MLQGYVGVLLDNPYLGMGCFDHQSYSREGSGFLGSIVITIIGRDPKIYQVVESNIFYVHPDPWGNDPIGRAYFFKWAETTT